MQIDNDRILKPYIRILDGHNTDYIDERQAIIKDEFLDTIYDLIQAGLVEKVEEYRMIDEEKIKRAEDSFAKAGSQLLDCGNRLNDTLNWINTAKPEWWNGKEEIKWK